MHALPQVKRPTIRWFGQLLVICSVLLAGSLGLWWSGSSASPESVAPDASLPEWQGDSDPPAASLAEPDEPGSEQTAPEPDHATVVADSTASRPEISDDLVQSWAAEPPSASAALPPLTSLHPRTSATLPILMYHHVDDLPRTGVDIYRRDLTVSPLSLRQQLDFLETNHVETVDLAHLLAYLRWGDPLPERAVILTFDDGYEDNFRLAYPLLRQYGMTGTFFIVADLVGTPGYMTWEQAREMARNGMAIESHSLDHINLAQLPRAELDRQLTASRRIIQEQLGRSVRYLNYPSGRYTPAVIAAARAAGYEAAVTVDYGLVQRSTALYELSRVRVRGADSVDSLAPRLVPPDWRYTRGRFGR